MTGVSHPADVTSATERMAERAAAFLDALTPDQHAKASFAFGDETERTDWAYFPRGHKGLPLLEMEPPQQKLLHALVSTALSLPAYAKVTAIMALESVLNEMEERRADAVRDPGRYFVSVFGKPGNDPWGWRLEGHHVSLNYTLAGDSIASLPIFLGANPAEVRRGETPVIRPCGEEEDAARELLASLDGDQRAVAVIAGVAPPDFILANLPRVPEACETGEAVILAPLRPAYEQLPEADRDALRFELARPAGLDASRMSRGQRSVLSELIDVYVERLPDALAAVERQKIDGGGLDNVHFAWAGSAERREGHYYRLQGPSFLVEYDNTQDGANHVHAVWRNPDGDFGSDLLARHARAAH
jgi:hypothetical protein